MSGISYVAAGLQVGALAFTGCAFTGVVIFTQNNAIAIKNIVAAVIPVISVPFTTLSTFVAGTPVGQWAATNAIAQGILGVFNPLGYASLSTTQLALVTLSAFTIARCFYWAAAAFNQETQIHGRILDAAHDVTGATGKPIWDVVSSFLPSFSKATVAP